MSATLLDALVLRGGYNAALVAIGAALLGAAAGFVGAFLLLRRRALVSDAIAHATLPGLALAFLLAVQLGGDGRSLPWLLAGSAASAALGLLLVQAITRRTRLSEDAAIGAVLSVFFGAGIVLMTIIQSTPGGRQAGLQSFLLGSTAGMLQADAVLIAVAGLAMALVAFSLRRPLTMAAFDPAHARSIGVNVGAVDLALLLLALGVTVIGLKIVGLVLIVALLIIPPVTARFWSEDAGRIALASAVLGGAAAYVGAAISAALPQAPTGPVIVLASFALFVVSLLVAPGRGLLARLMRFRRFQREVHLRQGLLAIAHDEPVHDAFTLKVLRRGGFIRLDGVATDAGRLAAREALRNERRWEAARRLMPERATAWGASALRPVEEVLTRDEIVLLDRAAHGGRS